MIAETELRRIHAKMPTASAAPCMDRDILEFWLVGRMIGEPERRVTEHNGQTVHCRSLARIPLQILTLKGGCVGRDNAADIIADYVLANISKLPGVPNVEFILDLWDTAVEIGKCPWLHLDMQDALDILFPSSANTF